MPILTIRRAIAIAALMIVLAALFNMYIGEFIPTPLMVDIGLAAGAGFALLAACYGWKGTFQNSYRLRNSPFFRAFALGLLAFWFGFNAFAAGLPGLYTKAAGVPAERHTVVAGWHARHRNSCAGPDIPDANTIITHLCWSQKLADGTALTLHGEQSALGFEVESFAPTP